MPTPRWRRQSKLSLCAGSVLAVLASVAWVSYESPQRLDAASLRVSRAVGLFGAVSSAHAEALESGTDAVDYAHTGESPPPSAYDATAHLRGDPAPMPSSGYGNAPHSPRFDRGEQLLSTDRGPYAGLTWRRAVPGVASLSDGVVRMVVVFAGAFAVIVAAIAGYGMNRQIAGRRRAEAHIDSFFDTSPDPFVVSTFEGQTLRVNPAYEEVFGYSAVDLASEPPMMVVHPDDRDRAAAAYVDLVTGARSTVSFACRAACKDGTYRWATWHAAAIPERMLIFAVARDETARKRAEDELRALNESLEATVAERTQIAEDHALDAERAARDVRNGEEQLRIYVENTPAAVAMLDRNMIYLVASRQWSNDYGLTPESLVGRNYYDVFPGIDQRWRDIHQRCLRGATEQCDEDAFLRADGHIDWVRWQIHPWCTADGEVGGIIMLSEVITARKLAQQEQLDTTADLIRINAELEAFTYSVSHDLKEPLRTLEAFSQFLLKDYADRLDAEGKDYLQRLAMASSRMKQLIDDLLTISRIGSQDEAPEPVAVDRLVADIVDGIRITVQERNATVDVAPGLPEVFADARRVGQIFSNLISNGIKFNRGDAPRVEVGSLKNDAGETVFFVRDNGIGIDPEYHEKIFGVFQRLHRREEFEGTGAGLAIVKRAVEALGGRIWVESSPGDGTTFLFTLPVAPVGSAAVAVSRAA